jgi:hypothetical protein
VDVPMNALDLFDLIKQFDAISPFVLLARLHIYRSNTNLPSPWEHTGFCQSRH